MEASENRMDSAEFIVAFRSGKEAAFDYVFDEFYRPLFYFSFNIIKDRLVAEEIVSDQFVKLWQRKEEFSHTTAIRSFLYTSAKNASIDHLRRLKTAKTKTASLADESVDEKNIEILLIESEVYREVFQAVEKLPKQAREVLRLFYIVGEDYKEIARRLNLSVSTVRVQKARALELLRRNMPGFTIGVLYLVIF